MLAYYATEFDSVEINSTYYGVPAPRVFAGMAARTPEDFCFIVKANSVVTHERRTDAEVDGSFRRACEPLQAAGKFGGTLVQFPWGFQNTRNARDYLRTLRHRLPEAPVFVEFRHVSWADDSIFDLLRETGLSYSMVDAPRIQTLMPAVIGATSAEGYLRLHGRNARDWWKAGADRYDYDYSEAELIEWTAKLRALGGRVTMTYIFFNNCQGGQAARNAKLLKQLLSAPEAVG
jgi:uncharacterized protein YecE (DUF72 family)